MRSQLSSRYGPFSRRETFPRERLASCACAVHCRVGHAGETRAATASSPRNLATNATAEAQVTPRRKATKTTGGLKKEASSRAAGARRQANWTAVSDGVTRFHQAYSAQSVITGVVVIDSRPQPATANATTSTATTGARRVDQSTASDAPSHCPSEAALTVWSRTGHVQPC